MCTTKKGNNYLIILVNKLTKMYKRQPNGCRFLFLCNLCEKSKKIYFFQTYARVSHTCMFCLQCKKTSYCVNKTSQTIKNQQL